MVTPTFRDDDLREVGLQRSREQPTVSVLMLTFNHEPFVGQAIESVLMQRVDFGVELLIGEDCSTDETRAIVQDYARRYPNVVVPILHERNVGAHANFQRVFHSASGKYHALLEGDDYWTHPMKLQRQVEFLKAHPDFSIAAHNVEVVYEGEPSRMHLMHLEPIAGRHTLRDILKVNFIASPSVLYRAGLVQEFPKWFAEMPLGDWTLHILNAVHGDIFFDNDSLAVYRVHAGGAWSQSSRRVVLERTIVVAHAVDRHFRFRYHAILRRTVAFWHYSIAESMRGEHVTAGIRKHLWFALLGSLSDDRIPTRQVASTLFEHTTPRTFAILLKALRQLRRLRSPGAPLA